LLFVDEIHRMNAAQQDALLPIVEDGTVTLIGATTEAPSFEINAALLSRARVVVLQSLSADDLYLLMQRALSDTERGLGARRLTANDEALHALARDARRALGTLEAAAAALEDGEALTIELLERALQQRLPRHDKSGEQHFDLLSAYHKSLRGSDVQGALYWMARMVNAGEDPMTIIRRAMAMAAEDIGLADPRALQMTVAARDAYHMLGVPEGLIPLAEMTIYLATAPKSNRVIVALRAAIASARETPNAPVPLHLRNAPTRLHASLGHGAKYEYSHTQSAGVPAHSHLPDEIADAVFYEPSGLGYEKEIAKRLEWWAARIAEKRGGESAAAPEQQVPTPDT
jgi:putative ATPase